MTSQTLKSKDQNDEESEEWTDNTDANEATEELLKPTKEFPGEQELQASCDSSSDIFRDSSSA